MFVFFFFSSRRRHTRFDCDWSSDVCSSDLAALDLSAAGTYGTLYGTLQHIAGGEQFYIRLLTGEGLGTPVRKTERRPLDDLVAVAALTGTRAIDVAANDDAARAITPGEEQTTTGIARGQLAHHSNEQP